MYVQAIAQAPTTLADIATALSPLVPICNRTRGSQEDPLGGVSRRHQTPARPRVAAHPRSVFNHYRRIEPLAAAAADEPPRPVYTHEPANEQLIWDQPDGPPQPRTPPPPPPLQKPSFDVDYERTNGVPDSTRAVGAGEDGSDPTVTHDILSREEKWGEYSIDRSTARLPPCLDTARGDGYFSSRRPPTLLSKMNRRAREADLTSSVTNESERQAPPDPPRPRKKKQDDDWRAQNQRKLEDAARARRAAELHEAMASNGDRQVDEDPNVTVEKSNVLIV